MKSAFIALLFYSLTLAEDRVVPLAEANGGILGLDRAPFQEPFYPEGTDVKLLRELTFFFDEREEPRPVEDWESLVARMKKAGMPRMATKVDLKTTKDELHNLSGEPVLVVMRHLHPLVPQFSMNLEGVEYRAHWLAAKGSFKKSELGFGTGCTVLTEPRLMKDKEP